MAIFSTELPLSGSGLVQSPDYKPSKEGLVTDLTGNPNLQLLLDQIETAGAQITIPKTRIGENGFMGFFEDSEGNLIELHSDG